MEWTQEKCLQLIDKYRDNEILWNPRHPKYYNNIRKEDAWREIATEFNDVNQEKLKKKIESLKASYRREKTKTRKSMGTGAGRHDIYVSRWFAFEYLRFLDDKDERQRTLSNPDEQMDEIEETDGDTDGEKNEDTESEPSQESHPSSQSGIGQLENQHPRKLFRSPKKLPEKRKASEDPRIDEAFGILKQCVSGSQVKDECSTFGEYVASKLRKLDERYRAMAEHQINNILFEMQMQQLSE